METNKLIRWLWGVIGVLVLLNAGLIGWLFLGQASMHAPRNGPLAFRFLEQELKLSEEQQQQIIASREKLSEKGRLLEDSVRQLRQHLFALAKQPENSDVEANRLGAQISRLIAQLETNRFAHFRDIRRICTPAQQARFDEILQELAQRQGPPGGGGPPGRRGEGDGPPDERGQPGSRDGGPPGQ